MYLSNVDLGFLGWKPDLGNESLPAKTWPALKMVPYVFVGVGAFMTATSWIIGRRMKIAEEQAERIQTEEKQAENSSAGKEEIPDPDGPETDKKDEAESK